MANVIDLDAARAARESPADASALREVDRLLEVCRKIDKQVRRLNLDQRISLGYGLDPQLIAKLEALVAKVRVIKQSP